MAQWQRIPAFVNSQGRQQQQYSFKELFKKHLNPNDSGSYHNRRLNSLGYAIALIGESHLAFDLFTYMLSATVRAAVLFELIVEFRLLCQVEYIHMKILDAAQFADSYIVRAAVYTSQMNWFGPRPVQQLLRPYCVWYMGNAVAILQRWNYVDEPALSDITSEVVSLKSIFSEPSFSPSWSACTLFSILHIAGGYLRTS